MTDKAKLIELKQQFVDNFFCGSCEPEESKCRKCLSEKEAAWLLENGVKFKTYGEWIEVKTGDGMYNYRFKCSKCKHLTVKGYVVAPDFCPGCGADMRGGKNG